MLNNLVVVFDLDDTLCYEINYLKSAYKEIALYIKQKENISFSVEDIYINMIQFYEKGKNAFENSVLKYECKKITTKDLIHIYRNHKPNIKLPKESIMALDFLKQNNIPIGLITDGRSLQQRSKIEALGLYDYIQNIIISEEFGSEKPAVENYLFFEDKYNDCQFMYVGDNIKKDFVTPNKLGWYTVCLKEKKGINIHSQDVIVENKFKPQFTIDSLEGLIKILLDLTR